MSNPTDRGPAALGQTDAATLLAQMQAAIAEVGQQRNGAQTRAVELAAALAVANARVTALEAEVGRLQAAEKEWRALGDAAKATA